METPPEKSTARELTEQALVAGAGMVPVDLYAARPIRD